jgi:hypothetical protein
VAVPCAAVALGEAPERGEATAATMAADIIAAMPRDTTAATRMGMATALPTVRITAGTGTPAITGTPARQASLSESAERALALASVGGEQEPFLLTPTFS